ncbi:MAG: methyl-accepting chemotaxis protein [Clostridiales Family XIII bacterium]|jgi:methyl-accepting chemotaxis protein|nr:methyl-accepting chemotaxis protein [Clostridiales Family XIII bacterium]
MISKMALSKRLWFVYIAYDCISFPVLIIAYFVVRHYGIVHDIDISGLLHILAIFFIGAVAIGTSILIPLAMAVQKSVIKPIIHMEKGVSRLALGDISMDFNYEAPDELGRLSDSLHAIVDAIRDESGILDRMAGGNYTDSIEMRSESDDMLRSVRDIIQSNNEMLKNLRGVSLSIADASGAVAGDSQNLAVGANKQAAAIEQLSVTVSEIQDSAASNVVLTDDILTNVGENAERIKEISQEMEHMISAMNSIKDSSRQVAKVISVIDSIAFQTNILALNAAVEAARAGQHGKGFAVVADEVRSLAGESANAAKETAALIEASVSNVESGSEIVDVISSRITEIEELIASNSAMVNRLHKTALVQSSAIRDVNSGIADISSVVQTNTVMAEKSSSSAQQLSAESSTLKHIVESFKLK